MGTEPTMTDVSRACGLSVWTVSQVLNGREGVSESSREKVLSAARELGYVLNKAASDLKRNERRGIAVITASTENAYYIDMLQGIHASLRGSQHTAMVSDIASEGHYTRDLEDLTVHSILGTRPAGVITALPLSIENIDLLRRWGVAVVFVDSPPPPGVSDAASVTTDNIRASLELGEHLAVHGYVHWLALMYPEHWPTRSEREEGLRRAADLHGATLTVLDCENDPDSASSVLQDHLERNDLPEVLIAGNNPLLRGMLTTTAAMGISIPTETALVAFDEFPWAPLMTPALTVIDEDATAIGHRATSLLLDLLDRTGSAGTASPPPRVGDRLVTRARLIVRSSCGCPKTTSPTTTRTS